MSNNAWRRCLAPLFVLTLALGTAAAPAQAAAPLAPAAPPLSAPGQDCTTLRAQAAKLAAAGQRTAHCIQSRPAQASAQAGINAGCFRNVWVYDRRSSCNIELYTYYVYTVPDLVVRGEIDFEATSQTSLSGRSLRWTHTIRLAATYSWGTVSGTVAHARANCNANCGLVGASFDSAQILHGSRSGSATLDSPYLGAGGVWHSSSSWTIWFTTPGVSPGPGSELTLGPAAHRCDDALGTTAPAGCAYVMASTVPEHQIGSARYPKYARHISLAINFGLPSTLTRTTDPALNQLNYNTACPTGANYPRPAGMTCDEYPFRSTRQGAASHTYGRTFLIINWNTGLPPFVCNVSWLQPRRYGDFGGYSVCMVPAAENSGGGTDLNVFYIDNRVIDGDQFTVRVV